MRGPPRATDALAHVVRVFDDEAVSHPDGRIDPVADAETAQVIHDALAGAGVPEFTIALNNRKILDGLLESIAEHHPMRRVT